ncbi:MAG: hypothetical protein ACXU86_06410, partial [Archangium sp.]
LAAEPPAVRSLPAIAVSGRPHPTLAFKPANGFSNFTLAPDGRIFLSCQFGASQKVFGLCMLEPTTGTETLLVEPKTDGESLGMPVGDGSWVVYGRLGVPQRVMAHNLDTREEVEVGRLGAGKSANPIGLVYAINGSRVVWVDEAKGEGPQGEHMPVDSVMLFELQSRKSRRLMTLPPGFMVDQLSLDGDTLVWSEVDTHDEKNVKSVVKLQELRTGLSQTLSQGDRASMPRVSGQYVVWKTATRFSYGGIELYDLRTHTGKELVTADAKARRGYDMPSISPAGVTWLSANNDSVPLYHPDTGVTETLDKAGGRTTVAGKFIAWISDSVTRRSDWHLLWSDLHH